MSARAIARRYAKALAEIGESRQALTDLQEELHALDALVRRHPDLERLVSFPLIAPSKRAQAFDAVLEQAGSSEILRKFFAVVAQAVRLSLLHEIVAAYDELVDEKTGIMEARVTSAHPLTPSQAGKLEASLASRTRKRIRLQCSQDPSLLGGLKVQLGSTVYDASLSGRLRLLRQRLLTA